MKQGVRFFVRPRSFFTQLQFSTNHWFILLSFLVLATVETQVGKHTHAYQVAAGYLQNRLGVGMDLALWLIMAAKMASMLAGAFAIAMVIYLVGSTVGRKNSRRVLFRRLSVVFTVVLAGFTVHHFAHATPWLAYAAYALYAWGAVLGYVALKEQFEANHFATALVTVFAALMVTSTWHFSNQVFETAVRQQVESLAKSPRGNVKSRPNF